MSLTMDNITTCPDCAGLWIEQLTFDHLDGCSLGESLARIEANDLAECGPDATLTRQRTASSAEELAAEAVGIQLPQAAPFLAPGQPASISRRRSVVVEVVDGKRRYVTWDGRDIDWPTDTVEQ